MALFEEKNKNKNNKQQKKKPSVDTAKDEDAKKDDNVAQSKGCAIFDIYEEYDNGDNIDEQKDELKKNKAGRWPKGVVPYTICVEKDNKYCVQKELIALIKEAIDEFHCKTPIKWKPKQDTDVNYVEFCQDSGNSSTDGAYSQCGCLFVGPQLIQLSYPNVARSTDKMTKVGVMHEMMHCLGFVHEHQRQDVEEHHNSRKYWDKYHGIDPDFLTSTHFISIGHYDYTSIMHYNCQLMHYFKDEKTETEMKKYVGKTNTFSKGDIGAIKLLYGLKDAHYGEWHRPCSSARCTDMVCYCGSCGQSKPWCGFHGKRNSNGHWTCCMEENKNSNICHSRGHTGFWHMRCEDGYGCTDTVCECGACGVGCKHVGKAAHWSCCYEEKFDKWCKNAITKK